MKLAGPDELWKLLRPKNPERDPHFTVVGEVFTYFDPFGGRLPFVRVRRLDGKWRNNDDPTWAYRNASSKR